jgi:uncharacterized protein YegP (UPF0339 family)
MIFELSVTRCVCHGCVAGVNLNRPEAWSWELKSTAGEVIARSPVGMFTSEAEARSHVASAKKSMKGAWRCKVVSPDVD